MPITPDALDDLRARIGDDAVVVPQGRLGAYERPARGKGGRAEAIIRPAGIEGVRSCVRWARTHSVRLLPQGANSGLVGASTPGDEREVVVVSTERLADGLVVDVADRTAVVPAGMRLSTLNDTLEPDGLFFPIDLAADPSLGGMAATNTGGARMLRYGDVRRRVLGIEAVIADDDASVINDLSVLRKDNTGIDLSALFVGSSGALGIITRVAVDLAVRPRSRAAMLFLPADAEAAVRLLIAVEHAASDVLSAFELMSVESVRSVLDEMDDVANPFGSDGLPELSILVELSGPDDVDDRLLDIADAQSSTGDLTDAIVLPAAKAWDLRHRITEALAMTGVVVGFDISVPRSALAGFRTEARTAVVAAFPRATTADFGHWGDGGMHFNIVFPPGEPPSADERDELRELVFGLAVDGHGGSYSAEHGIGPHNASWWQRSTPPATRATIRAVKTVFDPLGVLGHPGLPY